MHIRLKEFYLKGLSFVLLCLLVFPFGVVAQDALAANPVNQEELDSLLAPIALYPDSLVSQILMASTYPLEVVKAQHWANENKDLKGEALAKALEVQTWDASVKSLVNFPQVLEMMNSKLDWTQKLGDAVLADQKAVLATVQNLRQKAQAQGNLKTTSEQKVIVEKETQIIIIESANPQVVYVPTYNPTVVYGVWWWPLHPPHYYYPAGYVATSAAVTFTAGVAVGVAWGHAYGHADWHHGEVNVNYNQNNSFNSNNNTNINRDASVTPYNKTGQAGSGSWQHDPSHRQGVSYGDQVTAQKYNKASATDTAKARESFRGYSDQGRKNLSSASQPGVSTRQSSGMSSSQPSASTRQSSGMSSSQPSASTQQKTGAGTSQSSGGKSSAFSGYDSGKQTASQSSRGSQSLQSMSSSQSHSSGSSSSRSKGGRR